MKHATPRPVERLIEAFSRLPGIGPKTASRLTFYLLRAPEGESQELSEALREMKANTILCQRCFNISMSDKPHCLICTDGTRRGDQLCVVEEPLDVMAIERTGVFEGTYHVLHGALSPVEGVGPDDLRLAELFVRLEPEGVQELIIATNPTLEGEATAMYIKNQLEGRDIRLTRLARGLPSGGDLEYADQTTLSQALEGRSSL
jgi:recombination protein RecR